MWCLYDPTPSDWRTIDQLAGGKLRDKNAEESWELIEDLALYDNKSLNDPRDFVKLVKEISLPQDVPSASDRRLIELENQNRAPPKNGIIKCPSKLLFPKHQSQASLGDEGRNSLYPKRVHFVNTITIIRKEDELKEAKCLKLDSDDRHLDRNNENLVDKESKASEIVIDEEESSDLGINDDRG
ncbi:hypothetical protein Tco_0732823 [Tanacetum coccineum]